ncbi:MAG TPA: hypothetical protein VES02_10970 [Dermatophilaceae bacterium]|nr:hypothetical protein [Dermatophilaceae bacterium]
MFPYQIYQALTDQRLRDLSAEARHRKLVAEALLASTEPAGRRSPLRDAVTRLVALTHLRASAPTSGPSARSRMTSAPSAGPMGCAG